MSDDDAKSKINEIHRVLVGEPDYQREGLISKVERHEGWIANAKVRIAGIVGACSVIVWLLNKLL